MLAVNTRANNRLMEDILKEEDCTFDVWLADNMTITQHVDVLAAMFRTNDFTSIMEKHIGLFVQAFGTVSATIPHASMMASMMVAATKP